MKFKVGDEVTSKDCFEGIGVITYVEHRPMPYRVSDSSNREWWCEERDLTLVKNDLRDLLKVGYKVDIIGTILDDISIVLDSQSLKVINEEWGSNLVLLSNDLTMVNAIYCPKYNGLKPMEWELVWERQKEKLFTLELQGKVKDKYYYHGLKGSKYDYKFDCRIKDFVPEYQTKFTQSEIDNLPNQDFIKTLVKKPV